MDINDYETVVETAKRLGKSRCRILQMIKANRIPGVVMLSKRYLIPKSFVPENIDYRTVEGRRLKESYKMFVADKDPNNK